MPWSYGPTSGCGRPFVALRAFGPDEPRRPPHKLGGPARREPAYGTDTRWVPTVRWPSESVASTRTRKVPLLPKMCSAVGPPLVVTALPSPKSHRNVENGASAVDVALAVSVNALTPRPVEVTVTAGWSSSQSTSLRAIASWLAVPSTPSRPKPSAALRYRNCSRDSSRLGSDARPKLSPHPGWAVLDRGRKKRVIVAIAW